MSTYVVAGATGRVGSVVASELLAQGQRVRVIVRDAERGEAWAKRGAEPVVGSLGDRAFLASSLRGADGFFTILPEDATVDDFHGTRRRVADAIAAAVSESGIPHVVMLSAVAACLAEGNGPASDLHYLETLLRATAPTLTTIRSAWFQENVAMVIAPATTAGIYPNFAASSDNPFPTVATRDVGRLAASLLVAPPGRSEIVDLAGPAYSVRQLANALGTSLGRQLQVVDIPAAGRLPALLQAGLSPSFAEAVVELYACLKSGRIRPMGDRSVMGTTTIDQVIPGLLSVPAG